MIYGDYDYNETVGISNVPKNLLQKVNIQYGNNENNDVNNEIITNHLVKNVNTKQNIGKETTKDIFINDCCEESKIDANNVNEGEYYDPFMYGFTTPVGYKSEVRDKYVTKGEYNPETDELDLQIHGTDPVKISLSGVTGKDERVTGGTSDISETNQTITLNIGDKEGYNTNVEISLSGMGTTYATKTEMEENKPKWEEF